MQFHLAQPQPPHELVVTSTAVRLERRPRPEPPVPRQRPAVVRAPAAHPARHRLATPPPIVVPRELARAQPSPAPQPTATATPQPHPKTLAQALASQQRQFEETIRQLRAARNPLSIATIAPSPSTVRRSLIDISGQRYRERATAVLVPVKHWTASGMSCYYTRYTTQFSGGGSEEGVIPWPVCYAIGNDRMLPLNIPHDLPVPFPPPGYQLPANTYLTPFLRRIYDARG